MGSTEYVDTTLFLEGFSLDVAPISNDGQLFLSLRNQEGQLIETADAWHQYGKRSVEQGVPITSACE